MEDYQNKLQEMNVLRKVTDAEIAELKKKVRSQTKKLVLTSSFLEPPWAVKPVTTLTDCGQRWGRKVGKLGSLFKGKFSGLENSFGTSGLYHLCSLRNFHNYSHET